MRLRLSLAFCLAAMIAFVLAARASARELNAELGEAFGDVTGIRGLTLKGRVEALSFENHYAYDFNMSPGGCQTDVGISKSSEEVMRSFFRTAAVSDDSRLLYIPVEPYRTEVTESGHWFTTDVNGENKPLQEYRIYAETFEAVPCLKTIDFPLKLDGSKPKLYADAGPDEYIYSMYYDEGSTPPLSQFSYEFGSDGGYGDGYSYYAGYGNASSQSRYYLQFDELNQLVFYNEINFNEVTWLVPTGSGIYGHTAVYSVEMPNGVVPTVQESSESEPLVIAEELYPIDLKRGEDEIRGMIELEDGVLLVVKRGNGFEVTRIKLPGGEGGPAANTTVHADGESDFMAGYLNGDSLVFLRAAESGGMDAWAFDIGGGGLRLVYSVSAALWDDDGGEGYRTVHDALYRDGALYIAESVSRQFDYMPNASSQKTYVTALNEKTEMTGRMQVFCGVEEDYSPAWPIELNMGSGQSRYRRYLRSLEFEE